MKKKKQNINCDVSSCKHNKDNKECNLDEIKISSNEDSTTKKDETICDSFEEENQDYSNEEGEEEEDIECDE